MHQYQKLCKGFLNIPSLRTDRKAALQEKNKVSVCLFVCFFSPQTGVLQGDLWHTD